VPNALRFPRDTGSPVPKQHKTLSTRLEADPQAWTPLLPTPRRPSADRTTRRVPLRSRYAPPPARPHSLNPARACAQVRFCTRDAAHVWTGSHVCEGRGTWGFADSRLPLLAATQAGRRRCCLRSAALRPAATPCNCSLAFRTCGRDSPCAGRGPEDTQGNVFRRVAVFRARPHPGSLSGRDAGLHNALVRGRRKDAETSGTRLGTCAQAGPGPGS
jgi:hypothetical protein